MPRYCLALDLKNDPELIKEYVRYHKDVWPDIKRSITDSGITNMEIYLTGNRMFMIMETDESFSFERKADMDKADPTVQKWEELMWNFQQALPHAAEGEKWKLMDKVFQL